MKTLPQLIEPALDMRRERLLLERRHGEWAVTSSDRLRERIGAIACGLRDAGLQPGERVALISNNCVDWIAVDLGILFAGCVSVPIFATTAGDQIRFMLDNCGAKLVFSESEAVTAAIRAACPSPPPIVTFDGVGAQSLAAFEAAGLASYEASPGRLTQYAAAIAPNDLAVLIYTSGTTGEPKGVMLTHNNLASNLEDAYGFAFPTLAEGDSALSVLPFAHIYEHTGILGYVSRGCECHVTVPDRLLDDMRDARPVVANLVPRIYERVLAGLVTKSLAEGGLRAKLVPWALEAGRDYMDAISGGRAASVPQRLRYLIAHTLVLKKIRPGLGLDRLDHFTSGSAPLHRDTALTFAAADIQITQGYGLTETSPVITSNRVVDNRFGSVGRPIPNVEVKIAEDGEILARGPNVMKGYYGRPDDPAIDADGWFFTGDIGRLDADGFLYITDRKKELIKTSNGKYVSPARVESALKRSIYVSQVAVVGDGHPHPAALVTPNWELLRKDLAIDARESTAAIAKRADVREIMRKEIEGQTHDLGNFEQIHRFSLLPRDLTIEDDELSPTLKVKRRIVERRYSALIDAAYSEDLHAVPHA